MSPKLFFFSSSSFFHSAMVFKKRLCSDKVFFIKSLFRENAMHRKVEAVYGVNVGRLSYIILDLSFFRATIVAMCPIFLFLSLWKCLFFASLMKWQNAKGGLCL